MGLAPGSQVLAGMEDGLVGLLGPHELDELLEAQLEFHGALCDFISLKGHTHTHTRIKEASHLHLLERALVLFTPGESLRDAVLAETALDPDTFAKEINVDKRLDIAVFGQLGSSIEVASPEEMVHKLAGKSDAGPFGIGLTSKRVNALQSLQMLRAAVDGTQMAVVAFRQLRQLLLLPIVSVA